MFRVSFTTPSCHPLTFFVTDGWNHRSNENKGVLLWARVCAWTMIAGLIFVVLLWGIAIDRIGEEQRQNPAFAPVYGKAVKPH